MAQKLKYNGSDEVVVKYAIKDDKGTNINETLVSLQDQIDNLKALGRFLSIWYADTHTTETMPTTLPYTYITGDYFIVGRVASAGATNYKPDGTVIPVGSTYPPYTTESNTIAVGDFYKFDGTSFIHIDGKDKSIGFANITGNPTDNQALANALNSKLNKSGGTVTGAITLDVGSIQSNTNNNLLKVNNTDCELGSNGAGTAIKGNGINVSSSDGESTKSVNVNCSSFVVSGGTLNVKDSNNHNNIIEPNDNQTSNLTFQLPVSGGVLARASDIPPISADEYVIGGTNNG